MAHTTSGSFLQRGFLGLCAGDRSWEVAKFHPVSSGLVGMYVCAHPACIFVHTVCMYMLYVYTMCADIPYTLYESVHRMYIHCVHECACVYAVYFCVHILCPYPSVR